MELYRVYRSKDSGKLALYDHAERDGDPGLYLIRAWLGKEEEPNWVEDQIDAGEWEETSISASEINGDALAKVLLGSPEIKTDPSLREWLKEYLNRYNEE